MRVRDLLICLLVVGAASVALADEKASAPPTAAISGRVLDSENGAPVSGMRVYAYHRAYKKEFRAVSDAKGRYRIPVPPGLISMGWKSENPMYEDSPSLAITEINVPKSGLKNLKISARRLQVVTGVVKDESGQPLKGIGVTVGAPGRNPGAVTGVGGRFVLILPRQGPFSPG